MQSLAISIRTVCLGLLFLFPLFAATAQESEVMRIGVIGLDTSHAPAFTKLFNQESPPDTLKGFRVVAAYPHGSRDIESSYSRIPKYTETVSALGVEIVDSIEDLLSQVDGVLLETNDGKPHLEQAAQVFRAGKPVFIDKPCAQDLAHTIAIYELAKKYNVPMFSSSSLRFNSTVQATRNGASGKVVGCDTYSPNSLEPSHTDFYWYGIHGCEILYTCMGTGCVSVQCISETDQEVVVGQWDEGRVGTFRGMRAGKAGYGGNAFCEKGTRSLGPHEGYEPLIIEIAKFFRTGKPPVSAEETIELYTFMQAAHDSKHDGGKPKSLADTLERARGKAAELIAKVDP